MKKVRCVNQHFYDEDRYSVCPHCGAPKEGITSERGTTEKGEIQSNKSKKNGLFWKKDKSISKENTGGESKISVSKVPTSSLTLEPSMEFLFLEDASFLSSEESRMPHTEVLIQPNYGTPSKDDFRKESQSVADAKQNGKIENTEDIEVSYEKSTSKIMDLDDVKTVTQFANEIGEEPVTGWLVAIEGIYRGKSFSLKAGVNIIGRNADAYVCLKKDAQVSRNKHAVLIYEPKQKKFYLGEGDELVYCNGELVYGRQELAGFDKIEIGRGTYMFVPLCGLDFDWTINN